MDFIRERRQLQSRPRGGEIAIQETIHDEHGLRAIVAVGLELLDAFALLVLERQHIHEPTRARAITFFDDFGGHVEPREVLLRDGERLVRERGAEQRLGKIAAKGLESHVLIGDFDGEFGGGHLAHRAGFAEERKLLFDTVNEIAIIGALGAFGGHRADTECGIIPSAHGADSGGGGVGAGAGGKERGMIRRHFFGELIHQSGRDPQQWSAGLRPGSLRHRFKTRRVGDRHSERRVHRHGKNETAKYFCFHADRDFFLRRTTRQDAMHLRGTHCGRSDGNNQISRAQSRWNSGTASAEVGAESKEET